MGQFLFWARGKTSCQDRDFHISDVDIYHNFDGNTNTFGKLRIFIITLQVVYLHQNFYPCQQKKDEKKQTLKLRKEVEKKKKGRWQERVEK